MIGQLFVVFALLAILAMASSKLAAIVVGVVIAVALIACTGPLGLIFFLIIVGLWLFLSST